MKIINVCVGGYVEGWGYQENLLPEYEHKAGYDVIVFAPRNSFPSYVEEKEREHIIRKGSEYEYNGVRVIRYNTYLHTPGVVIISTHLFRTLLKEKPDIVFHHGSHPSLLKCALYRLFHRKTVLFVDNHVDYINQSKNVVWNFLIRKVFLRIVNKISSPLVYKFYGVSPGRCDYLREVYNISTKKISLLPIGGDVDMVNKVDLTGVRSLFRIPEDSFVICMGGKLEESKGTTTLVKSYHTLKGKYPSLQLVVFGKVLDEKTKEAFNSERTIINLGWRNREDTIKILKQSQIAIWPIHHTTLIEDAVSCSTPVIIRKTGNTCHLVEDNGILMNEGNYEEVTKAIETIYLNFENYKNAAKEMSNRYSYPSIVKMIMDDYKNAIS